MRAAGFTLVELLVVLAIAAAAVGIALPQFSRLAAVGGLKSETRTLAALLRSARSDAIAHHAERSLLIDVRNRAYRFEPAGRTHRLRPGVEVALIAAHTEVRDVEAAAVRFFADGSSSGARVTLASASARYIVDVDWLTGRVAIHE
jgi:general secretion pathway protein H